MIKCAERGHDHLPREIKKGIQSLQSDSLNNLLKDYYILSNNDARESKHRHPYLHYLPVIQPFDCQPSSLQATLVFMLIFDTVLFREYP